MVDIQSSQLWAYDDIFSFESTQLSQPELKTQFGKAPAAAFCPSCGALTLDVADTEVGREAHVRNCRDSGEPDADEAHSDGEDSPEDTRGSSSGTVQSSSRDAEEGSQPKRKATDIESLAESDTRDQSDDVPRPCRRADSSTASPADSQAQQQSESTGSDENRVQQWLQYNGLADQAEAFTRAHITPDLLKFLADEDLRQMGVSALGPRRRILAAIQNLPASQCGANSADSSHKVPPTPMHAFHHHFIASPVKKHCHHTSAALTHV